MYEYIRIYNYVGFPKYAAILPVHPQWIVVHQNINRTRKLRAGSRKKLPVQPRTNASGLIFSLHAKFDKIRLQAYDIQHGRLVWVLCHSLNRPELNKIECLPASQPG